MDLALKTALTASVITLLILAAQWLGEQAAGMLSGLPFTTVPALLMVAGERGAAAAADVAAGGIVGCALASLFAVAYHSAARRLGPVSTLLVALASLAAGLALAHQVQIGLGGAAALALVAGTTALAAMRRVPAPRIAPTGTPVRHVTRQHACSAMAVGAVSASVASLVLALSPSLAGIVATMPIIGVAVVVSQHSKRGHESVTPFLRGYVLSSTAKAAFCAVFALCAMREGVAFALLAALALSFGALASFDRAMVYRRSHGPRT